MDPLLIGLLAGAGAIVALWGQIKSLVVRLLSYVVVILVVDDSPLTAAVRAHCITNMSMSRFGVRCYSAANAFVRPRRSVLSVAFERISGLKFLHRGWRFLFLKYDPGEHRGAVRLVYLRGMFRADRLLSDAMEYYNGLKHSKAIRRYRIVHVVGSRKEPAGGGDGESAGRPVRLTSEVFLESRLLDWKLNDLGPELATGSPLDSVILPDHALEAVEEARFWRQSEDWYRERGIPWRRGWLLHGAPGTGKTTLARALAEELDLPVHVYDLSSLSNDELRGAWTAMLRDAPAMALIEDIDGVFRGRVNVSGRFDGLSFDALLNCIDGMERASGIFVVVTTNHPEQLDEAIGVRTVDKDSESSRPGRIDRVIELKAPDAGGLLRIARRVLPQHPRLWEHAVLEAMEARETAAQFQERCARLALKEHWDAFRRTKNQTRPPHEEAVDAEARADGSRPSREVQNGEPHGRKAE